MEIRLNTHQTLLFPSPFIKGGRGDSLSSRPGIQSVRIFHSEQKSKVLSKKFHSGKSIARGLGLGFSFFDKYYPDIKTKIHSELVAELLLLKCSNEATREEKIFHDVILEELCLFLKKLFYSGEREEEFQVHSLPGQSLLSSTGEKSVRQVDTVDEERLTSWINEVKSSFSEEINSQELKDFFEVIKPLKERFAEISEKHLSRWNELASLAEKNLEASQSSNQSGNSNRSRNSSPSANTTKYSPGVIAGIGLTAMVIIYLLYSYISKIFADKSQSSVSTNTEGGNLNFVMPSVSQSS